MNDYLTQEIFTLRSAKPGPSVVLFAGIHGNETCGLEAFKRVMPDLRIENGTATFIIGNPAALSSGVRFIETNLNRLFRPDAELSDDKKKTYEYRRSRELIPLLMRADALLDIHSSASKDSKPFVICCPRSRSFAEKMPFPIISWGWDVIEPGGTDDFMERIGKIGMTIECGYHGDPEAIERAERAIHTFLALNNLIMYEPQRVNSQRRVEVTGVHKAQTDFIPARIFADFEPVCAGELIGTDGGIEYRASKDSLVIFVRERKDPGEEAFLIAEER